MKNQFATIQLLDDYAADGRTFEKDSQHKALLQDGEIWISTRPNADITIEETTVITIPPKLVRILRVHQPPPSDFT